MEGNVTSAWCQSYWRVKRPKIFLCFHEMNFSSADDLCKQFREKHPYCYFTFFSRQGFSYLSEVGARGLLNLGKKNLDPIIIQNCENLMQF